MNAKIKGKRDRMFSNLDIGPLVSKGVGETLQSVRRRQGWKQDAFADALGISRTTASNIERGAQRIYVDQLYRAAAILQVPVHDLLPPLDELLQDEVIVHPADEPLTNEALDSLKATITELRLSYQTNEDT
jgi:transcriptional regulator with XRE-family HTH domain